MEKTNLQIQIENAGKLITNKIEEAIENGAKIERPFNSSAIIDGVIITLDSNGDPHICLDIDCTAIRAIFEPDKEELEKQRAKLLEEIKELNKKLAKQ